MDLSPPSPPILSQAVADSVQHPNVGKIMRIFCDEERVHLIMPYYTGGELYDRIVKQKRFAERDAATIMRQLLGARTRLALFWSDVCCG